MKFLAPSSVSPRRPEATAQRIPKCRDLVGIDYPLLGDQGRRSRKRHVRGEKISCGQIVE